MQTATRFYKTTKTDLTPISAPVAPMISWAPQLVFSPGYFAYNAPIYDIRQPGLYVFTHYSTPAEPWNNTTHMIVHGGDPIALLSAAAWLTSYGDGDNSLSMAALSAKARGGVLSIMCGIAHPWAADQLLAPQGVQTRRAHFLTMQPWNGVVDGHEALEVLNLGGRRVLVDLSNNCLFLDQNGDRLSANQCLSAVASEAFSYELLADDSAYSVENNGGIDVTAYARREMATESDRRRWHRRIFQAIGMWSGAELWWKLPPSASITAAAVEALSPGVYKVKPAALWDETFYPSA